MNEMINYIFGNMKKSEYTLRNIQNVIKNQAFINQRFTLCIIITITYMVLSEIRNMEYNSKINELNKELQCMKGE